MIFKIDKNNKIPVFRQLIGIVETQVQEGVLKVNDKLPSINQVAKDNKLAKETVVKAYKILQERGIIKAIHGKAYYIQSVKVLTTQRVFLLLDTFMAYKESMYKSLMNHVGDNVVVDVYFHHYNIDVFEKLIQEALGNYTRYVIIPFSSSRVEGIMSQIPEEKLLLADLYPQSFKANYQGVWQDFHTAINQLLTDNIKLVKKYRKLELVFRNAPTKLPIELKNGFIGFCEKNNIQFQLCTAIDCAITADKGIGYIVIDDNDLVSIVEHAIENKLRIGEDIGIISYNETALKKVVAKGISVITTDFASMGRELGRMIQTGNTSLISNECSFIDRGSF